MYNDADIITFLQTNLGQEAAQTSLERLLRVPSAWEALQQPEFLKEAVEASGSQALFPSLLAALSLGVEQLSDAMSGEADKLEVPEPSSLQLIASLGVMPN